MLMHASRPPLPPDDPNPNGLLQRLHVEHYREMAMLLAGQDVLTADPESTPVWAVGGHGIPQLKNALNRAGGDDRGADVSGGGLRFDQRLVARPVVVIRPSLMRSALEQQSALQASHAPLEAWRAARAAPGVQLQARDGCLWTVCWSRHSSLSELRALVKVGHCTMLAL
jgi:hypothetical protein